MMKILVLALAVTGHAVLALKSGPNAENIYDLMKAVVKGTPDVTVYCRKRQDPWKKEVCAILMPMLDRLDEKTAEFLDDFKDACKKKNDGKCELPLQALRQNQIAELSKIINAEMSSKDQRAFMNLISNVIKANNTEITRSSWRLWKRARNAVRGSRAAALELPEVSIEALEGVALDLFRSSAQNGNPNFVIVYNPDGDVGGFGVSDEYLERAQAYRPPVQQEMTSEVDAEELRQARFEEIWGSLQCESCDLLYLRRMALAYTRYGMQDRGASAFATSASSFAIFIGVSMGLASADIGILSSLHHAGYMSPCIGAIIGSCTACACSTTCAWSICVGSILHEAHTFDPYFHR